MPPAPSASSSNWRPERPNILVTGTPGTGKTTFSSSLSSQLGLSHLDVGAFARDRHLLGQHDPVHNFHYLDEDGVLDALEPLMTTGGVILDHHSCDWFPERWVQLVVVMRAKTETLFDRLNARGYNRGKVEMNVQAEIMEVCKEEAVSSYPRVPVLELMGDEESEIAANVQRVRTEWRRLTSEVPLAEEVR